MPALVGVAIRYILIAAVQLGIFAAVEKVVIPLLHKAISEVMQLFGVSEDTAEDIVANEYLAAAESVGLTAAIIMSKTPLKVTDRLGFSSKGWGKRVIKAPSATTAARITAATGSAAKVATSRIDLAAKWASVALSTLGIPVGVGLLVTNTIDFGAWPSSAYQGSVQKFLSKFGLEPDADARAPRTTSNEVFGKVYAAFQLAGVASLEDPYKQQTVTFTRNNLLDLADKIAADILIEKGSVTTKLLVAALLPFTNLSSATISAWSMPTTTTTTAQPTTTTTTSGVKVFTAVMSQGKLGESIEFVERPDDLISTMAELQDAVSNNLAPWLASLFGKIIYEVKLASSVRMRDGTTQYATVTRVVSSYTSTGKARYKTVRNKFAVLNLYIMTDRGTRTKISQITLGPTDAATLTPTTTDLAALDAIVADSTVTTNVADITAITTPTQVTVTQPAQPAQPAPVTTTTTTPATSTPAGSLSAIYRDANNQYRVIVDGAQVAAFSDLMTAVNKARELAKTYKGMWPPDVDISLAITATRSTTTTTTTAQPAPVTTTTTTPATCRATTLYEYYTARGLALPIVGARAVTYQSLGLGPSAYYTGTAEQNTRLLAALKRADGCAI